MKIEWCPQCGGNVVVTAQGTCPAGHPLPGHDAAESNQPTPRLNRAPVAPASSASRREVALAPARRSSQRTQVLVAVVAGALVLGLVSAGAWFGFSALRAAGGRQAAEAQSPAQQAASDESGSSNSAAVSLVTADADGNYPPVLKKQKGDADPSAKQKRWALATCALLTEMNGERHDILSSASKTPENVKAAKQVLADWWGIESRGDLLDTLEWIEHGGHRKDFNDIAYALSIATPQQLSSLEQQMDANPDLTNEVNVVKDHGDLSGEESLAGWDFARYVFLCRRGYLVGYLSEAEAWKRIMRAARAMQSSFPAWRRLGDNYLVGREFWSKEQTETDGSQWRKAEGRLLEESDSPWVTIPWDTNLDTK